MNNQVQSRAPKISERKYPKLDFFESSNCTVFTKVNVISPANYKANASVFPNRYDYESEEGTGVGHGYHMALAYSSRYHPVSML